MKFSTFIAVSLMLVAGSVACADIPISNYDAFSAAYSQNFNTLSGSTALMPADWHFSEAGSSGTNNGLYAANTGSGTASDTYNYGTVTVPADRALGELSGLSTTFNTRFGAEFQNVGNTAITKFLSISYRGEQYRLGSLGRVDALDFEYSTNATSLTTGTWTALNGLDFIAPLTTGTTGAKDGNAVFTNVSIGKTTLSSPVAPGGTFWIRWLPRDATGADDGLAIDDFSITAIPEPSSVALCGVIFGAVGFGLIRRRRKQAVR